MSDAVAISLISAIGSVMAAGMGVFSTVLARRNEHNIRRLEENTNSIKDALVKVTGESEHAKGVIEGTRTEKIRQES
jgi:hypothetical protein